VSVDGVVEVASQNDVVVLLLELINEDDHVVELINEDDHVVGECGSRVYILTALCVESEPLLVPSGITYGVCRLFIDLIGCDDGDRSHLFSSKVDETPPTE